VGTEPQAGDSQRSRRLQRFHNSRFEQNRDATRVTETLEMRVSGLLRLMEPLMRRQARRQEEEIHRRFNEILERGAS
jgi:hypothetical protein